MADLRRALDLAEVTADCECPPMDAAGRAGRGRLAPRERGLRCVQQAVLRHFATTGHAPEAADLEHAAAPHSRQAADVLSELADEDFLTLDTYGRIRAAYPFSAVPTAHRLRFPDGTQAWSMCAIDALGIPAMLDTNAVISSSDPVTGEPVTVTSTKGHMVWEPATAVVFVGQRSCTGPAADTACGALNFFTSRATAHKWSTQHHEFTGNPVDQTCAEALGQKVFGRLLTESNHA
ncbi:alkylmercury lyase family protein [Streptomyces sp. NPDC002402]